MEAISIAKSSLLFAIILVFLSHNILSRKVNAHSKVHIVYMGKKQHPDPELSTNLHHDILTSVFGSKEEAMNSLLYSYKHGFSGFAAKLTDSQAQKISELPGVIDIRPDQIHALQTTRSWDYLGLSPQSSSNLLHDSNMGDGIIIGLLDSGIWPESDQFNDSGLSQIPSRWKGRCDSGARFNATSACNRKLIGAKWYVDGFLADNDLGTNPAPEDFPDFLSPRDANGHGTHTAATAAGSFSSSRSYRGLGRGLARGGAPRARVAIYKVCWNVTGGTYCSAADILKGFDEAVHDGIDVLSVSLAPFSIPAFPEVEKSNWIATGSYHAVMEGIVVICAGGNRGPSSRSVQNTAPWVLTVAASTIDRSFPTKITLGNNVTIWGQAMFTGKEVGYTGLLYSSASGACESLSLTNDTRVIGNVVLCFSRLAGSFPVSRAASTVKAAGGAGVIVANNLGDTLGSCSDDFPCIEVDYELGTQILFYIRSTRYPIVKLNPSTTLVGKPISSKVAYFSARGPNPVAPAILKPDIAAPGVSILAASSPFDSREDGGFAFNSGTSMATPHISGIVALLKALHPSWSPSAIKSALVTTAWKTDPFGEHFLAEGSPQKLADPFDYGGGLVNPNKAANPGLVYDMDQTDYTKYLCAVGYDNASIAQLVGQSTTCPSLKPSVLDVNMPSITIPNLRNSVTVTRTVTNVGPINSVYKPMFEPPLGISVKVRPELLFFNSSVKALPFTVEFSTNHKVNTGYYFGSLTWTDNIHVVTVPISVKTQIMQFYTDDN